MASFGLNLVLVVSVVLIFFTTSGYSLTCYDCDSFEGELCGNYTRFNGTNVIKNNCIESELFCAISKEIDRDQKTHIRRKCGAENYCAIRNTTGSAPGSVLECRTCKSNLCNSSYNVVPSFGIITFLVLCFTQYSIFIYNKL